MSIKQIRNILLLTLFLVILAGCDELPPPAAGGTEQTGQVVRVIDGDTIDVRIAGEVLRVRYIGVNTPERDEPCYAEATAANSALVANQTVRLLRDQSETDPFGRLLRYVYVGSTFVNRELVVQGYAEAVLYPPDDAHWQEFRDLEIAAAQAGRGCHPTGVFDDGSYTR